MNERAGAPTAGLHVITSNRLEDLGAALAKLVRKPCPTSGRNVLQPEIVVVQSKGMQRWLSLQVARHNGVCANLRFPFPNAFVDDLYSHVVVPVPQHSAYEPSAMAFRIMRLLPTLLDQPLFLELRRYLQGPIHPIGAYGLARKIADLFDQYMIYRPEMLAAWEAGHRIPSVPFDWQALLWQTLKREIHRPHRADLQRELIGHLESSPLENLPPRVCVFGISHLPPFHLQVLKALSERIAVSVFAANPCRQYWFDIVADATRLRIQPGAAETPDLHYERGNRLLASWGRMGKHFFSMLHDFDPQTSEVFADASDNSLLKSIQKDILDLVDRPSGAQVGVPADGTIRIQCCHSVMREVEVLHDQLLSLFDRYADLKAGDVMVMTPDINAYAPYIQAVFGAAQLLPYSVSDQTLRRQSSTLEAFTRLLDVCQSRFEAGQISALLEFEAIRERFDLAQSDLPIVEDWIRRVNIRWGWDAADRKRHALPGFSENSWRSGLDRLLAGYAMMPQGESLIQGILPFDAIEGSFSRILGSFAVFAESLYESVRALPRAATLQFWGRVLSEWLDRFFKQNTNTFGDIQLLRNVLSRLGELAAASDYDGDVAFEVIRRHIQESLERITSDTGFMVGGVTFCAMLPMRSIPAEIICLLGLQHDAFPQDLHEPKFNLLNDAPRIGDRSKRNDEKYMFLEALLSTRRVFYLSYVGRGVQDNAIIPPSVLVDELIEYICENYAVSPEQLVTIHPLHAFSPVYFDGRNRHLFSYSQENLVAAHKVGSPGRPRNFFENVLPEPAEDWRSVDIKQLSDFFAQPARFLLERRLGIRLHAAAPEIDRREAFNLEPLDRFIIEQKLADTMMAGVPSQATYAALRAAGILPHGSPGKVLFEQAVTESAMFVTTLQAFVGAQTPRRIPLQFSTDGFDINGEIGPIFSKGIVIVRTGNIRPRDLLTTFINHLLLNLIPAIERPASSYLVAPGSTWQFATVTDPDAVLKVYLELYWRGLKRPLQFFPESSYAFAHQVVIKNMPSTVAMKAARSKWHSSAYRRGESGDPYFARVFNEADGLRGDFQDLAVAIFEPLLKAGQPLE